MMDDLLLHPAAARQLSHFVARPTHGLLLSGQTGLGKTLVARALVAQLLDISPTQLARYRYFRSIEPVKGTIAIATIRELLGFFKLKTGQDKALRRFTLIADADALTIEAQNALLKLLEEPPADSLILLTSAHPERLLPTVRSRTQIIPLTAPDVAAVTAYFVGRGFSAAAVEQAWLLADGSVAAVNNLLQAQNTPDEAIGTVKQALAGSTFDRLLLVDKLSKDKDRAQVFVATLVKVASVSADRAAASGSGSLARWYRVLRTAHTASEAMAQNSNIKLLLTDLMLSLS
jgi:hypothetical protein